MNQNQTYGPMRSDCNVTLEQSYLAQMRIPQLPVFSGENQKADVSFEVWKFELNCLINESVYPNSHILQAVRKSLRGRARDILLTISQTTSPTDILNKLEGIYGNVSSKEVLMQQFYMESQREDETVADYSIRIENLLRRATQGTEIDDNLQNERLCSKLWNGLRDPLLKNSSRYKYDVQKDFNILRRETRSIEQDLMSSKTISTSQKQETKEAKQLQQSTNRDTSTHQRLDALFQQMKLLKQKVDTLGKKAEEGDSPSKGTKSTSSESNSSTDYSSYNGGGFQPRGRGCYNSRRSYTGYRGRGSYGNRGGYNSRGGFNSRREEFTPAKTNSDT